MEKKPPRNATVADKPLRMRGVANCSAVTRAQRPGPGRQPNPASNKLAYVDSGFCPAARMSKAPARRLKSTGRNSQAICFRVRGIIGIRKDTFLNGSCFKLRL